MADRAAARRLVLPLALAQFASRGQATHRGDARSLRHLWLTEQIQAVHTASRGTYGSCRWSARFGISADRAGRAGTDGIPFAAQDGRVQLLELVPRVKTQRVGQVRTGLRVPVQRLGGAPGLRSVGTRCMAASSARSWIVSLVRVQR
jgi:hypothetical protein